MGRQRAGDGKGAPSISKKVSPRVEELLGGDVFLVHDVLTPKEAAGYVSYAEGLGFSHQGSRGAAYGEVNGRRCACRGGMPPVTGCPGTHL